MCPESKPESGRFQLLSGQVHPDKAVMADCRAFKSSYLFMGNLNGDCLNCAQSTTKHTKQRQGVLCLSAVEAQFVLTLRQETEKGSSQLPCAAGPVMLRCSSSCWGVHLHAKVSLSC